MKRYISILLLLISYSLVAQQNDKANDYIESGIKQYDKAAYDKAENNFRKALAIEPANAIANYNLAETHLEQSKNRESLANFKKAARNTNDKMLKSKAYFNQGNIWYKQKKYEKSVEAYKNALRNNPNDEEARYNLALAMEKLKKQNKDKNKDKKKNKDKDKNKKDKNKNKKDKNKNKKDKDKNKDKKKDQNKDKKQDKKKNDDKKKGDKKQNQPKQGEKKKKAKLTPQQVKQLLVALKNKEQKTQNKIKAKRLKGKGKKQKQEKDW